MNIELLNNIPLDDKKVYDAICEGRTAGVFQLETRGMTDTAKKVQPREFEELALVIALFRPISIQYIDKYVRNKKARKFNVLHPAMRKILAPTWGIMVYQEQAMEIVRAVAGFSLAEADELRRVIAKTSVVQKEKSKSLWEKLRMKFFKKCKERSIDKVTAVAIWKDLEAATDYSFNKAHAVSYAYLAYQMMWFKVHHSISFMTALLNKEIGDADKTLFYYNEGRFIGLKFLPMDVRHSAAKYQIENGSIRPPLTLIKGIGEKAVKELLKRKKREFPDLRTYLALRLTGNKVTELMIKAGAFDYLGERHDIYNEFVLTKDEKLSATFERPSLLSMSELDFEKVRWTLPDRRQMERDLVGIVL